MQDRMLNPMTGEACLRQTSRPNSTSSSSTIRRATSLSSQPGSRVSYFGYSGRHIADDPQRKPKYPNGSTPIQIAAATVTIPASSPSRHLKDGEPLSRGHSRYRGHNSQRSGGTEAGSSTSSTRSEAERGRKHKVPSQKTMLSRALQKANTAVLLDNAENFEGATEAYADACRLLQQVMHSSTGDEDKKKLEAIRKTYTNRIDELQTLDPNLQKADEKALPERPLSNDTLSPEPFPSYDGEEEAAVVETATRTRTMGSTYAPEPQPTRYLDVSQIPPRRQSLLPSAFERGNALGTSILAPESMYPANWSKSVHRSDSMVSSIMDPECMPPPLSVSPRKPSSCDISESQPRAVSDSATPTTADAVDAPKSHHSRDTSTETTSWLDTIDESGGSSASSLHSRHSSSGVPQKRIYMPAGNTGTELSAAMDAAVEAAYDESFDIAEQDMAEDDSEADMVSKARRNVERARQKVREAEHEDQVQEQRRRQDEQVTRKSDNSIQLDYLDEEAEEEERLLEEMTKGYVMDDFQFGTLSKSALPKQSDSSVFSGRTWTSSNSSHTAATAPSIAGLAEGVQGTTYQKILPPHPPPAGALPAPPTSAAAPPLPPAPSLPPPRPPSFGSSSNPGVRDRRLSGQNAKQLKIETHSRTSSGSAAKKALPISAQIPLVEEDFTVSAESSQTRLTKAEPSPRPPVPQVTPAPPLTPLTSLPSGSSMQSESPATPALARTGTREGEEPMPASPARFLGRSPLPGGLLRKNMSSSSLKMRNLSVTTAEASDISPMTPGSATFPTSADGRKGIMAFTPVVPTPTGNTFMVDGLPAGGMYLFDDQICSPTTPGAPTTSILNAPSSLEPCPEAFLLRPFWLMRCLYQTIAHPRGGYLSTRLFVPRDVWRVKNVKIKGIEDKVSNCDLLTAALLKLSKVDTLDADAVLEEMQSFETVLDQVRNILHKKLGSEVGLQSSAALFKGSPATDEPGSQAEALSSKGGNATNKSYLSSWRKLRSKSSGAGLTSSLTALPSREGNKETLSMSSIPITSTPSSRPHQRNLSQVQLTGPNANYMGALARLFDAVQILDQIARQVEDPGLKYSSKTHVGLELSTRNAAEFFAFYVCRFALNDVGLMLDKFIKRGSEWVLA